MRKIRDAPLTYGNRTSRREATAGRLFRKIKMMYDDDCPACHKTYASFRILHEDFDPDAVTRDLGVEPTETHRQGDVRNPRAREFVFWRSGGWFLRSRGMIESRDIGRHVDWLLDQLQPSAAALKRFQAAGCRTDIFCYWVCAAEHGGPRLSPTQMARLADLGIEIGFDIYFTGDDE